MIKKLSKNDLSYVAGSMYHCVCDNGEFEFFNAATVETAVAKCEADCCYRCFGGGVLNVLSNGYLFPVHAIACNTRKHDYLALDASHIEAEMKTIGPISY